MISGETDESLDLDLDLEEEPAGDLSYEIVAADLEKMSKDKLIAIVLQFQARYALVVRRETTLAAVIPKLQHLRYELERMSDGISDAFDAYELAPEEFKRKRGI